MTAPSVFLVDDDFAVRDSLSLFFKTVGIPVECFHSAESFLDECSQYWKGCLILDVRMPGKSGLNLQEELIRRGMRMPVIFITGYGDVPTTVQAMKNGAIEFMIKPINMAELLDHVQSAIEFSNSQQRAGEKRDALQKRLSTLTLRESEILSLAIVGVSNKEIAQRLGISHRTVETHRSRVLVKTGVKNILELTRFVVDADSFIEKIP